MRTLQQENPNLMDMLLELVKKYSEDKPRLLGQGKLLETDHAFIIDPIPSRKINDIREIAKLMVGAGVENEFADMFISNRREFLQECLINKLWGLQEINIDDYNVEFAETMIKNWGITFEAALGIIFPIEQKLCDRVFSGISSTAARCFTEICQEATFQMLDFALAVADGSRSTWCMLKITQMYQTLCYLVPQFRSLFPDSWVTKAIATQNRLGEASRDLFMELDNLLFCVPIAMQNAPAYGHHHPIIDHVDSQLAEDAEGNYPKVDARGVTASCSFTAQIEKMIVLLETKSIAKSESYKHPAMQHIFMMNNRKHMNQLLNKMVSFRYIFGDDWFPENIAKIQQHIELYQITSWSKVLGFLKLDSSESGVTPELLIDKLNLFNIHFEEISREQSAWFVYDKELRKEVIKSLENSLLPAYGTFMGKFHKFLGNHAYNYIEYGLFQVEDRLGHLFLVNSDDESQMK